MSKKRRKPPGVKPGSKPPLRRSFTKSQRDLSNGTNRIAFRRLDAQANANAEYGTDSVGNGY